MPLSTPLTLTLMAVLEMTLDSVLSQQSIANSIHLPVGSQFSQTK